MFKLFPLLLLLIACDEPKTKKTASNFKLSENPDNILWDYSLVSSKEGTRSYKLWSERVEIYNNKKEFLCYDSLIVTFYKEENTEPNHYIHSVNGAWQQATNNFKAIKDVIVLNREGDRLLTDTLYYDYKKDLIYSEADVVFVTEQDTLYGTKFESNSDLSNIKIFKVTGRSYRD